MSVSCESVNILLQEISRININIIIIIERVLLKCC